MKALRITNNKPEYLNCSMGGTYYIPCKIIGKSENWTTIEYFDDFEQENKTVQISEEDVERVQSYYNKYSVNYKEELYGFLSEVKKGEIPLDKATEIILNDGEIKL